MRCATWVIHVACLLFVFVQGAWSCLTQNIDVKARHSFSAPCGWALGKEDAGKICGVFSVVQNSALRFEGVCRLDASAYGRVQAEDIRMMSKYLRPGSKVLDVGCGFGMPTSQALAYYRMSACDMLGGNAGSYGYDREFIESIMKVRLADTDGVFRWSEPEHIPFDDCEFDGILLYAVIEHVPNCHKEGFLRECLRVLKPGGRIFMYRAVNRRSITEKAVAAAGIVTHGEDVVDLTQMKRLFSHVGLRLVRWGYQGWLPENGLSRFWIYWLNRFLCSIPIVRLFSHDYWFVTEKQALASF